MSNRHFQQMKAKFSQVTSRAFILNGNLHYKVDYKGFISLPSALGLGLSWLLLMAYQNCPNSFLSHCLPREATKAMLGNSHAMLMHSFCIYLKILISLKRRWFGIQYEFQLKLVPSAMSSASLRWLEFNPQNSPVSEIEKHSPSGSE